MKELFPEDYDEDLPEYKRENPDYDMIPDDLEQIPTLIEFLDFPEVGDEMTEQTSMCLKGVYRKYGFLNWAKLIKDKRCKLLWNKKTKEPHPFESKRVHNSPNSRIVQFGQHRIHEDKLHGIGRKIWVCAWGEGSITEGQFKNG